MTAIKCAHARQPKIFMYTLVHSIGAVCHPWKPLGGFQEILIYYRGHLIYLLETGAANDGIERCAATVEAPGLTFAAFALLMQAQTRAVRVAACAEQGNNHFRAAPCSCLGVHRRSRRATYSKPQHSCGPGYCRDVMNEPIDRAGRAVIAFLLEKYPLEHILAAIAALAAERAQETGDDRLQAASTAMDRLIHELAFATQAPSREHRVNTAAPRRSGLWASARNFIKSSFHNESHHGAKHHDEMDHQW